MHRVTHEWRPWRRRRLKSTTEERPHSPPPPSHPLVPRLAPSPSRSAHLASPLPVTDLRAEAADKRGVDTVAGARAGWAGNGDVVVSPSYDATDESVT